MIFTVFQSFGISLWEIINFIIILSVLLVFVLLSVLPRIVLTLMTGADPAALRPPWGLPGPAEMALFVVLQTDDCPGPEALLLTLLRAGAPLGGEILRAAVLEVTPPHGLWFPLVPAVLRLAEPGVPRVGLGEDAVHSPGLQAGAATVRADTPPPGQPLLPARLGRLAVLLRHGFGLLLTVAQTGHFPVLLPVTTGSTAVTPGSHQPDV